jgi:hypothetical protein
MEPKRETRTRRECRTGEQRHRCEEAQVDVRCRSLRVVAAPADQALCGQQEQRSETCEQRRCVARGASARAGSSVARATAAAAAAAVWRPRSTAAVPRERAVSA